MPPQISDGLQTDDAYAVSWNIKLAYPDHQGALYSSSSLALKLKTTTKSLRWPSVGLNQGYCTIYVHWAKAHTRHLANLNCGSCLTLTFLEARPHMKYNGDVVLEISVSLMVRSCPLRRRPNVCAIAMHAITNHLPWYDTSQVLTIMYRLSWNFPAYLSNMQSPAHKYARHIWVGLAPFGLHDRVENESRSFPQPLLRKKVGYPYLKSWVAAGFLRF